MLTLRVHPLGQNASETFKTQVLHGCLSKPWQGWGGVGGQPLPSYRSSTRTEIIRCEGLNIPGCCWLLPPEQSRFPGEAARPAAASTATVRGGGTASAAAGSESVLLLESSGILYRGGDCLQWWGGCWRTQSPAGIFSGPTSSCFLMGSGVFGLSLVLHLHPLPGLQTQTERLSCTRAPLSLGLTDPSYSCLLA